MDKDARNSNNSSVNLFTGMECQNLNPSYTNGELYPVVLTIYNKYNI